MKKFSLSFALLALFGSSISAHELWVVGDNDGKKLSVDLIYGHNFAKPSPYLKSEKPCLKRPMC